MMINIVIDDTVEGLTNVQQNGNDDDSTFNPTSQPAIDNNDVTNFPTGDANEGGSGSPSPEITAPITAPIPQQSPTTQPTEVTAQPTTNLPSYRIKTIPSTSPLEVLSLEPSFSSDLPSSPPTILSSSAPSLGPSSLHPTESPTDHPSFVTTNPSSVPVLNSPSIESKDMTAVPTAIHHAPSAHDDD
jgi:hypothetical protein